MQRILTLGRSGPTLTSSEETCWVGLDPNSVAALQKGGIIVLGHECKTIAELQIVVDQLKTDLDAIVQDAGAQFSTGGGR